MMMRIKNRFLNAAEGDVPFYGRAIAFDSGMNGHVAKPVDIQKLKETIAKFV